MCKEQWKQTMMNSLVWIIFIRYRLISELIVHGSLGKSCKKWHQDIESLKKSDTFGKLDVESQAEIRKRNSFVLSLPVLCDVLLKCEYEKISKDERVSLLPPSSVQSFIDDIVTLDTTWKRYIIDNDNQMIPSDDMQKLREMFESIGKGMAGRFSDLGEAYVKTIERFRSQCKLLFSLQNVLTISMQSNSLT